MHSSLAGPNAITPDRMIPAERIGEVCTILARGLVRLKARQSSKVSGDLGESSFDFSPHQRGHGPVANRTETTP